MPKMAESQERRLMTKTMQFAITKNCNIIHLLISLIWYHSYLPTLVRYLLIYYEINSCRLHVIDVTIMIVC